MKRKVLSLITALALCLALCPLGAWASEGGGGSSGSGGEPGPGTETAQPQEIPAEQLKNKRITDVDFTAAYKSGLAKTYNGAPVAAPEDKDFVLIADDMARYLIPKSGVTFEHAETWTQTQGNATSDVPPKDAGAYEVASRVTLTVSADAGDPNSTATVVVSDKISISSSFRIQPKPLERLVLRNNIQKTYDGTGEYRVSEINASPINYIDSGVLETDVSGITFEGTFDFDGSNVGPHQFRGSGVRITGSKAGNYEIPGGSTSVGPVTAEIKRADASATAPIGTLLIRNRRDREYTYDMSDLLPEISGQYGEVTYTLDSIRVDLDAFFAHSGDEILGTDIAVQDAEKPNILTVKAKSANHDGPNLVAVVHIIITSQNFNNIDASLEIRSDDRTPTRITGLSTIRPEYNGKPQVGYTGRPVFSVEQADGTWMALTDAQVSPDSLVRTYQSTSRSQTVYGPSPEPPTEPGEYRVTLSIPESNEDYAGSWTGEFTITRAVVTVTALERHIQVDDPVPDLSKPVLGVDYTVSGLAEGDELRTPPTLKYSPDADSIMPGEFDILIDGAMVPDNTHYDPAIKFVRGKLTVTSLLPDQENPFSDVSNYTWYSTAVKYVYNRGLMRGVSATLFDPTSDLTRGMLVTILYRMEGEPAMGSDMPFTDLERRGYYLNAVRWAKYNRIVNGYGDGRFGPNDSLTREQMAIILYNYSRYCGVNVNKAASLDAYVDAYDTCSAGYRALQWACAEGLIQGTSDTTLSPTQTAMRAQVALVLMRYCMNIL